MSQVKDSCCAEAAQNIGILAVEETARFIFRVLGAIDAGEGNSEDVETERRNEINED